MGQVLIRNVPDDIIATYKMKAQLTGTSLEQYLRDMMEKNAKFTPDERMALSRKYLEASGGPHPPLSKDEIREGLE